MITHARFYIPIEIFESRKDALGEIFEDYDGEEIEDRKFIEYENTEDSQAEVLQRVLISQNIPFVSILGYTGENPPEMAVFNAGDTEMASMWLDDDHCMINRTYYDEFKEAFIIIPEDTIASGEVVEAYREFRKLYGKLNIAQSILFGSE